MNDVFFQFFLLIAGALIGVFAQTRSVPQQKIIAWVLAILLVAVSLFWAGYSTGYRDGSKNAIVFSSSATPPSLPTNTPSPMQTPKPGTPCPTDPSEVPLDYGLVVGYSICPEGDTDIFRFSGTSGERIRIQLTYQKGTMRPCMELIAPDNTRTRACENAFNNVIDMTLNQTGSYTIVVDVLLSGVGDYTLVVERL